MLSVAGILKVLICEQTFVSDVKRMAGAKAMVLSFREERTVCQNGI